MLFYTVIDLEKATQLEIFRMDRSDRPVARQDGRGRCRLCASGRPKKIGVGIMACGCDMTSQRRAGGHLCSDNPVRWFAHGMASLGAAFNVASGGGP